MKKGHFYMAMALLALLAVGCASCEREEGGKEPAPSQAEADSPEVEAGSSEVEVTSAQVEVASPGAGASFSEGEEIALRYRLRGVEEADLEIYLNDEELEIGNGQMLPALPAGEHSLRLSSGGSDLYSGSFHVERAPLVLQLQVAPADNACWPKRELRSEIVKPSGMSWKDFLSGMLDRSPEWGEQITYWKGEAKYIYRPHPSGKYPSVEYLYCYGVSYSSPHSEDDAACFTAEVLPVGEWRQPCFTAEKNWSRDEYPRATLLIKEEAPDREPDVAKETVSEARPVAFGYSSVHTRGYPQHDGSPVCRFLQQYSTEYVTVPYAFTSLRQLEQFLADQCGAPLPSWAKKARDKATKIDFSRQAVVLFYDSIYYSAIQYPYYPYIAMLALLRSGPTLHIMYRAGYHDESDLGQVAYLFAIHEVDLVALITIDRKDYEGVTAVESIRLRSPEAIARE